MEPGDTTVLSTAQTLSPLTEASPTCDFTEDAWVGVFPGLGSISVDGDGHVVVSAEGRADEDPEILAQRNRALRWGWADPLSWWRRGYALVDGVSIGHPDEDTCIVVTGDYHDTSRLVVKLIAEGWELLADRPSPYKWVDEELWAFPREAPFLMARGRAIKAGLEHQSVRTDSDSVEVDVPRLAQPRRVEAFMRVSMRRPFESSVEVLSGHQAFRTASGLLMNRPRLGWRSTNSASRSEAEESAHELAQNLRLVKIPMLRLRRNASGPDTSLEDLFAWREGR